jgi:UDP-N-acetylglucosamine--N-acetylmuramyl-(pentapeptide) pyrophosphoryl-undecaprenol N-acetylglucosamine transferase
MNQNLTYKVIISGGGTGGHVFPAIAIANGLKEQLPAVEILFVGANGKLEMTKVPEAGYKIEGLNISGFQRSLSAKNLMFPFRVIESVLRSRKIVNSFKPDIAIGVGGYASGPLLYVAAKKGIPTLLQEQNSYPGVTNKMLAKRAKKICVAYDGLELFFPKEKIVITGNPVRQTIGNSKYLQNDAKIFFKLDYKKPLILVIGGSLGARTLNDSLFAQIEKLNTSGVQVLWQCGKLYYEEFKTKMDTGNYPNIHLTQFITEMDIAYSAADLIISRAGAISISELCIIGKPVILVPSPNVAEDHQTKNAMALVNKEAAVLVKDKDARTDLVNVAMNLIADAPKMEKLAANIKTLARPKATENIVKQIIQLMN